MYLIVVYHIVVHCVVGQMYGSVYSRPQMFSELYLIQALMPLGMMANDIFIMISGYFLVEKGKDIKLGNVAKKLMIQLGAAALFLTFGSLLFFFVSHRFDYIFARLIDIRYFNDDVWFVGYYFAVIVVAALFLNKRLNEMEQKPYTALLLALLAFTSFMWSGGVLNSLAQELRTLAGGVFLYALGGYIKRFDPFAKIRGWVLAVLPLLVLGINLLSFFNNIQTELKNYDIYYNIQVESGAEINSFHQSVIGFANYNLIVIVLAVTVFELFRRLKMPNSKVINFIGGGTFMIYILHDNVLWYDIWGSYPWMDILSTSLPVFCLQLLKWSVIVFAVCLLGYVVYRLLALLCVKCKGLVLRE